MRRFICAGAVLAVAFAAAAALPRANAATPEESYIAARDAAVAKIKAATDAEKRGPMDGYGKAIVATEEKLRADLEPQMRAIVGPVAIKGIAGESALNLDTLFEGDLGFGLVDGMIFGALDAKTRVIVTTDSMFSRWLRAHKDWWGKDSGTMPQEIGAAVREGAFYTQAILTDSAVIRFAELPIRKPPGAAFTFAMLAARTQSEVPPKADEVYVVAAQGGKVFIAHTRDFGTVGPIAACDAIRADLVKQSIAAVEEAGLDDKARREKSDALSGKSESEFLRCFSEQATKQKGFATAVQAAQALLDRLPTR